jgi:hypothetical protein
VRHAELPVGASNASVTAVLSNARARITVKKSVAASVSRQNVERAIAKARVEIEEGRHGRAMGVEGGTGFHKLARLLAYDLGSPNDLMFGFEGQETFAVSFSVPLKATARSSRLQGRLVAVVRP